MAENEIGMGSDKKGSYYHKRPVWQWILIYLIAAGVIYYLVYLLFFNNKISY
ncbi:MAG TPA: hypothetical protein VJJ80_01775 [Patescibacteria group bacterium]|nr:hypothetical protein [Patescibacteria group bacterium]